MERPMFRRMLTAILIAATVTGTAIPAVQAGDGHRGWQGSRHEYRGHRDRHHTYRRDHGRHDYGRYDYRRDGYRHDRRHSHKRSKSRDYSDEILIGAGLVGLAIVAGSMIASKPREPEINWSDAPRGGGGNCETDEVYRHLPDGRIQYGDRTRCY